MKKLLTFWYWDGDVYFLDWKFLFHWRYSPDSFLRKIEWPFEYESTWLDINENVFEKFQKAGTNHINEFIDALSEELEFKSHELRQKAFAEIDNMKKSVDYKVSKRTELEEKVDKALETNHHIVSKFTYNAWELFFINDECLWRKTYLWEILSELSGKSFEYFDFQFDIPFKDIDLSEDYTNFYSILDTYNDGVLAEFETKWKSLQDGTQRQDDYIEEQLKKAYTLRQ